MTNVEVGKGKRARGMGLNGAIYLSERGKETASRQ